MFHVLVDGDEAQVCAMAESIAAPCFSNILMELTPVPSRSTRFVASTRLRAAANGTT